MDITSPNDTFQDMSTEVNPSTVLMSAINISTVSEYDIDSSTNTTVVTMSTRTSSSISSSSAMNTSMATLATSSPYIPEEFVLDNRMYFVPLITLILVIGIVANILAIIATRHAIKIYRTHRSRKVTIASYLIQCLMMVDLSAVLVFCIRGMFYSLYNESFFRCDLDSVTNYFFSWSAGFINAIMCFERCVALTAPFYYHSNATVGKAKVAVIAVLFLALLTALLPIIGFGSYKTFIDGRYYCIGPGDFMLDESGYDFHFGVLFLVTGLGILIFIHSCNTIVITKIVQIRRRASPMRRHIKKDNDGMSTKSTRSTRGETLTFMNTTYETTSSSSTAGNNTDAPNGEVGHHSPLRGDRRSRVKRPGRTEINVAKQIVVISIVFTISWLPFYIQRLLKAFDINQPDWYLLVVIFLLVSNHVIDPFVFVFMKQQSRDALKDLCMKCVCCRKCRSPPSTESQHSSSNGRHHRDASKQDSGVVVNVDPPYDLAHNRSHDPNHGHAPNSSFNIATNLALHPTQDSASYFVPSPDSTRNSEHDNSHNTALNPAHNASTS